MAISIQELKELNKRIENAKAKSASLQAEVKVLSGQLDTQLTTLSSELGVAVTRENLESLHAQTSQQLEEKATLVKSLLDDLEGNTPATTPMTVMPTAAAPVNPAPVQQNSFAAFGAMMNAAESSPAAGQPTEQPAAPNFANFGTATTFQI